MSGDFEKWIEWRPHWAPAHVTGRYTERVWDREERKFELQRVEAVCMLCGADYRKPCDSGRVREHIVRFAAIHTHGVDSVGERSIR